MKNDLKNTAKSFSLKGTVATLVPLVGMLSAGVANSMDLVLGGMVDTGLRYTYAKDGVNKSTSKVDMGDGMLDGNRFIFIGSEDLSPETKVGFWLEAGYNSDTGASSIPGKLFGRGCYMWLKNDQWGQLAFGRVGSIRGGATPMSFDITWNRINPFGTGWGDLGNPMYMLPFYDFSMDNMLHYDTPKFGPFQGHVEYSFSAAASDDAVEGTSSADRYASAALTFDSDAVNLVVMVDTMNEKSTAASQKDMVTLLVGGNVKLGDAKLYGWGSWFKDADLVMPLSAFSDYSLFSGLDKINGYAFSVGTRFPALGGEVNVYGMMMKADYDDELSEERAAEVGTSLKRYSAGLGYTYPLSKRTTFYAAAGVYKDKVSLTTAGGHEYKDPLASQVFFGINHKF